MKRWMKVGLGIVGGLAVSAVAIVLLAQWKFDRDLARVFTIGDASIAELAATADLTEGRYLYETRGCADCHGIDGSGALVFDDPALRVAGSNLTPAGVGAHHDADSIASAIRNAVGHDGRPLIFMPSGDWDQMSDAHAAAIAAYILALPPVENDPGPSEVRLIARIMHLFGSPDFLPATRLDHSPRVRRAPPVGANARYGFYVAQTCTGCHGVDFAGRQHGPPGTPRGSDLRPGAAMAGWSEQDFFRVMREGMRPDGSELHPFMPWQSFGRMDDVELSALWRYFETLPRAR
jgi:mono/diheme cytochrome c family protein